jgi:hypothetical protein
MIYAKKMDGEKISLLLTYDYHPQFSLGDDTVIISEDEYKALLAEIYGKSLSTNPVKISDTEEESEYINGIRKIPDEIAKDKPFSKGEKGIDANGVIWVSLYNENVYTPTQFKFNWEVCEA